MASRAMNNWRTLLAAMNRGASHRGIATGTAPRSKAYAPTVSDFIDEPHKRGRAKGELVPVYVALGLISLSASLGLYVANHQLLYAPNVYVSKKRRETLPEVDDPDWAVAEADRFLSRSIFRRVAHLQGFDRVRAGVSDPARPGSRLHHPGKVEDLRTVGVNPHAQ